MGLFTKRHYALQGSLWTLLGLRLCQAINQTTTEVTETAKLSDSGKEALIVICFALVIVSIVSISAYYCNFEVLQSRSYEKLEKTTEMVEVDLYESEEEAQTAS